MLIDITFLILIIVAIFKGYRKGLVIAVFSFIAFIVGIAAAIKLSAIVAEHLKNDLSISAKWLPVISFLLVFIAVIFLIRFGAKLIEKTFQLALMGWINRLAGAFLYMLIYTFIFSVLLFYADKIHVISQHTVQSSQTWPYIEPIGPKVINGFAKLIPVFKNMFDELESFFGNVSKSYNGS